MAYTTRGAHARSAAACARAWWTEPRPCSSRAHCWRRRTAHTVGGVRPRGSVAVWKTTYISDAMDSFDGGEEAMGGWGSPGPADSPLPEPASLPDIAVPGLTVAEPAVSEPAAVAGGRRKGSLAEARAAAREDTARRAEAEGEKGGAVRVAVPGQEDEWWKGQWRLQGDELRAHLEQDRQKVADAARRQEERKRAHRRQTRKRLQNPQVAAVILTAGASFHMIDY